MKKPLLIILIVLNLSSLAKAQNFPFGAWKQEELDMSKYSNDISAHAVVLNEYGKSKIAIVSGDEIKLVYEYHVKIKIFDNKGLDEGTIEIPVYNNDDNTEEVNDVSGFTVYKDDNGLVKKEELDPKKVYKVKNNKHYSSYKFAMPGLKNGCVIEYKYTLISPFYHLHFRDWHFQSDIPKIHSEYDIHIPGFWTYNISLRGGIKLNKNTSELENECFSSHGAKCDCSHLVFGMDNVPAFVEEDYMTAPKNFLAAVYFELSEFTNPYDGSHIKVTKEWKDIDYELKHSEYFGTQLKRKELLKQYITPVITNKTDELDKAKAVYDFVRKTIKWDNFYSIGSDDGIRKALKNHTGDCGDINLTLITALKAAGINTEAVILSTRNNGTLNTLFPVLTGFDYIIAKANIGEKSYLLDATDPLLAFGMLPLRCLNGQGRVMSLDKESYWVDMNTLQKQSSTYMLDLTLQDNGKIKGTITNYSIGYDAYLKRQKIKKFNTKDEYVENLDESLPKIKILKSEIVNLDSLDQPLGETYEVEIDAYDDLNHSKLGFNPFILDRITTNPFKLAERSYPIDWGMPSDTRYTLTLHLPDQYTIETPPAAVAVTMPNNGGKFVTNFESSNNTFTFSHIIQFNKAIYSPEEYPYLKELYNKIILSEKAEMVFKKKI